MVNHKLYLTLFLHQFQMYSKVTGAPCTLQCAAPAAPSTHLPLHPVISMLLVIFLMMQSIALWPFHYYLGVLLNPFTFARVQSSKACANDIDSQGTMDLRASVVDGTRCFLSRIIFQDTVILWWWVSTIQNFLVQSFKILNIHNIIRVCRKNIHTFYKLLLTQHFYTREKTAIKCIPNTDFREKNKI